MTPSADAIQALDRHWAVGAIPGEDRARADALVRARLARRMAGQRIESPPSSGHDDDSILERMAFAFEIAAAEGLDELGQVSAEGGEARDRAIAASFRAFDIRLLLPIPEETRDRLFFVLESSAMAYCGGRWSDLRRWYDENARTQAVPSVAGAPWDRYLLYRIFDCWMRLFRGEGRDGLDRIGGMMAELRKDQARFEEELLQGAYGRAMALRLAALYNWARATELVAQCMLREDLRDEEPGRDPISLIGKLFDRAVDAAAAARDVQHEITLRWLRAVARLMVGDSLPA